MLTATETFTTGARVASLLADSKGTVAHVLTTGRVHVQWDDGTNCSVGPAEITAVPDAFDAWCIANGEPVTDDDGVVVTNTRDQYEDEMRRQHSRSGL